MSELTLEVGQANELKLAFRRHGYTAEEVKRLCEGNILAQTLLVIRGRAEVIMKSILTLLRNVRVPAQPAITTSEKYFKEAGVVWMGNDFKAQFLGLEVPATEEAELAVRKLEEASLDAPILAELGDKAEIPVSQFCAFLAANRESQEWFIFYLIGKNGKPWAVRAFWDSADRGWRVYADSVEYPRGWSVGYRVVSR
ncbi:MAG: hypothetical protein AAB584_00205 [Patescibacteria group bacterium]